MLKFEIRDWVLMKKCGEQLIIGRRTHIVSSDCLQIKHKNYYISSISCFFFIAFGWRHFVHKLKHGWHFEMTSSFHLQKKFLLGYRVSSLKFIISVFVLKHFRGHLQTTLGLFFSTYPPPLTFCTLWTLTKSGLFGPPTPFLL